jgi:hypothetical protein
MYKDGANPGAGDLGGGTATFSNRELGKPTNNESNRPMTYEQHMAAWTGGVDTLLGDIRASEYASVFLADIGIGDDVDAQAYYDTIWMKAPRQMPYSLQLKINTINPNVATAV